MRTHIDGAEHAFDDTGLCQIHGRHCSMATTHGRMRVCSCASGCGSHPLADPGVFAPCHCWCHHPTNGGTAA